jgi:probable F420-dependent oxidoreductase
MHPGRFLLGLGGLRAPDQEPLPLLDMLPKLEGKPLGAIRAYLDAMDAAPIHVAEPAEPPRRVLAALGPKMLALAGERAAGALTYFVPVEHTVRARGILGADSVLAVEQAVVFGQDKAVARQHVTGYLSVAHHRNNLRTLGFDDDDFTGPSDRLIDAIVAIGDQDTIVQRVRDQLAAGADHVCIQVLTDNPAEIPLPLWRELAHAHKDVIHSS